MLIKYDFLDKICIQLPLISLDFSPSNEHLTSVDIVQQFVIVVQKIVCIIFSRVIS